MKRVCAALAVLAVSSTAHAGPEVAAGAPFTAEELGEALAARGVDEDVAVEAAGSDAVAVTTPDGAWTVELGEARGAAAARLVALHLAVEPEVAVAGPPAAAPEPIEVTGPPSTVAIVRAPAEPARWRVEGGIAWGAGVEDDDLPVRGLRVDVARTARRWRLAAGLGLLRGTSPTPAAGEPLHADLVLVRATAGIALGPLAVGVGPSAGLVAVDGGGHAGGLTLGLAADARVAWPVSERVSLFLGIDANLLQRRVVGRVDGMSFAASPRVAVGVVAGIGVELGR